LAAAKELDAKLQTLAVKVTAAWNNTGTTVYLYFQPLTKDK
jgi:hypothetical protein